MNENQNQGVNLNTETVPNQNPSENSNVLVKDQELETLCAMKCPKCGFGISSEATICLHCGYNVQQVTGAVAKDNIIYERVKQKKYTGIFIMNIILTVLFIGVFFFQSDIPYINDLDILTYIGLTVYIPSVLISMFYLTCYEMLLHKANLPWWGVFIPIYNVFEFYELCTSSQFFFLWNLVPVAIGYIGERLYIPYYFIGIVIVEIIIYVSTLSQLASRFDANKILMILFPEIYMPIVALNRNFQIN